MPRINMLTATTLGVDGKTNPLFLGNKKLHWATNLSFEEGIIRTRPGIRYSGKIAQGQFQGAGEYRPSMGLSSAPFAEDAAGLVVAVDGDIFIGCDKISLAPHFKAKGDVEIFQAENYLIFQNPESSTYWWDGENLTPSPGMQDQDWNDPEMPRIELEVIPPVGAPGTCGPGDGTGGGGGGCQNQGTVTFRVVDNLTEEHLEGAAYTITVNGNIAYEGIVGQSWETDIVMEEGIYDYSFIFDGYTEVTGSLSVIDCSEQEIVVRLVPDEVPAEGCDLLIDGISVDTDYLPPPPGNIDQWNLGRFTVHNNGVAPFTITEYVGNGELQVPSLPYTIANGNSQEFLIGGYSVMPFSDFHIVTEECADSNTYTYPAPPY